MKRDVQNEKQKVAPGKTIALSSHKALFYHDVPPELYRRIAQRYTVGHAKYSPDIVANINWRIGLKDPLYVADRFNHLFTHLFNFLENGNTDDDNLAAMAWCCGFLMEVERVAPEVLAQVVGHSKYFGKSAEKFMKELRGETSNGIHQTRGIQTSANRSKRTRTTVVPSGSRSPRLDNGRKKRSRKAN